MYVQQRYLIMQYRRATMLCVYVCNDNISRAGTEWRYIVVLCHVPYVRNYRSVKSTS